MRFKLQDCTFNRVRNDILSLGRRPLLEELSRSRLLLAFDYDGVLAPLGPSSRRARMRAATRRLLGAAARRYPTVVVSGRAYRDLVRLVGGAVPILVGNHGFEVGCEVPVPRAVLARVAGWRRELALRLAHLPGVSLEDKRSTLSVHYDRAPSLRRAGTAVLSAARQLHGARLVPGKKVVNVLPAHFPTKGDAVRELLAQAGLETALYLGDDVTDEDVFALGEPAVVGVRVGPGPTQAPYRLGDQADIDEFLRLLASLRGDGTAAPGLDATRPPLEDGKGRRR